ncbi:uncharacterized protein LOC143363026 [Halictus rubicundus]|uniref:uncharacterized protein LOC143363026 n=1 Tax=Halictus rubicundus TaxID=77578 RepID=UPI004035E680
MLFHLVVLLSLSWPHVIGTSDEAAALDQIATASANVAKAEKLERNQETFRDQLITSIIDTTVHYENSNGFVPMVGTSTAKTTDPIDRLEAANNNVTWTNSLTEQNNSTLEDSAEDSAEDRDEEEATDAEVVDEIENDPAYSTEARIFLNFPRLGTNNRRSFEYNSKRNDFELLKVQNDTPVVANYPDFYEDPSSVETESEKTGGSSRYRSKARGHKLDDYMGNYGEVSNGNEGAASNHRYSPRDKEKSSQEKVPSNYHQQEAISYDGHGHGATRQNGQASSSLPRTTQEVNNPPKSNLNNYDGVYDNVAASSQPVNKHQRLSRPVVVAEYSFEQSRVPDAGIDDYQTSRFIDSASSEVAQHFTINNRDGRFRSDEDSRDVSDDGDYTDYTERPRRVQKSRRRPSAADNAKRLPKEHRGTTAVDDSTEYEHQGKRHHSTRTKSHRQRVRGNSWSDDDRHRDQDDSYEETRYDGRFSESKHSPKSQQSSKFKPSSSWNQISPNLEISHSSGVEIGQLEKPKFIVPVKLNLVPLGNFDHATALGNSQGFDMSNAVLQNIVSATPSLLDGGPKYRQISTAVPDIVVGQNNFQGSMQAVLPHANDQDKYSTNAKQQYVSSTVAPVFAVTPSVNPNLQSIPLQDVQGTVSPRPAYVNQMQQVPTSPGTVPQLIVPQPTLQTVPTLVQTSVHSPTDFNIQVNPHGMHGQNLVNHENTQVQNIPTVSTVTPTPRTVPVTKINLVTAESQSKKPFYPGSSANFLATATLSFGQNDQRQSLNGDSYYLQSSNTHQVVKPQPSLYQQAVKNVNIAPKTKTYIQTTHLLPAMLQPMPTVTTITANGQQAMPGQHTVQGTNYMIQPTYRDQAQQFVNSNGASTLRNIKLPSFAYQTIDNVGSHSTNNANTMNTLSGVSGTVENAQLPYVGTRNVEILNPNMKPTPIDGAIINTYEAMHYPAAVFTTPFPMFTTTSVVTSRPALLSSSSDPNNVHQNLMNSLTEVGSKNNMADLKAYQSQERPMFNPINFVPNMDVVKNQNALNSKLHASEPLQQNLNLVPLIPGGNFFKPSLHSQTDLLVKPKLNTDLETYAEQMFKESLKTIYNSQKWNNDRKPGNHRPNATESDIAKLKHELQRLKASLSESKRNKDHEAHHSETKLHTAEFPSKKPDEILAALEQMLKSQPSESLPSHYGNGRPHRHRRPGESDKYSFGSSHDFRDNKHIRDSMGPPHSGSRGKGHYHDQPGKKRPSRYNGHFHGPRSHSRHNLSPKSGGFETSATNVEPGFIERPQFENFYEHSEPKKGPFDSYSSFAGSPPERNGFTKVTGNHKGGKDRGINHPKMHNFLGLLMKNKQLPHSGTAPNYFRDKDQLKQFFEDEKLRSQQLYDETMRDYLYKLSESNSYANMGSSSARRSLTEKGKV